MLSKSGNNASVPEFFNTYHCNSKWRSYNWVKALIFESKKAVLVEEASSPILWSIYALTNISGDLTNFKIFGWNPQRFYVHKEINKFLGELAKFQIFSKLTRNLIILKQLYIQSCYLLKRKKWSKRPGSDWKCNF